MELDNFQRQWQQYGTSIESTIKINEQNLAQLQKRKVHSKLASLYYQNVIVLILHVISLLFLTWFVTTNLADFTFAFSGLVLIVFYVVALISTSDKLLLIRKINLSDDIATAQRLLLKLQMRMLHFLKLSVLFIPAFLAYPVVATKIIKDYGISYFGDFDIFKASGGHWELAQIIAATICIPVGLWFYHAVSFRNLDKKWVKKLIVRISKKGITEAMDLLESLKDTHYPGRQ